MGYGIAASHGPIAPAITGLGPGTASPVRVSALGRLERVASPTESDDYAGMCDASGLLHAAFGSPYPMGGGGGNPWAGLEDAYGIPFWNSEGEPQVFQTVGSKGVEVDDVGEIRVAGMLGSKFDASAYLEFERYNWPEGFDLAADYAMPIGHKFAVTFGAGDGPFGPAWLWPPDSSATLDVVTSFTSGTAERRIARTYLVKRVGTGTLTVTQDGSGTPSGDALASVDVTLSVDTSPYLKLTVVPAAGATNSLTEISGHLKRRPA